MSVQKYLDQNISRLSALQNLEVLDSGSETVYDEITSITAALCEAPVCLISLVETGRQWFKSEVGLGASETDIKQSICSHAVKQDSYLEVHDTHLDPRTKDNSLCQGEKPFRFYAGAIMRTLDGWPLGTLCVLDYKPRHLTELQQRVLRVNANSVMRHMELTKLLTQDIDSSHPKSEKTTLSPQALTLQTETQEKFATLTPREKEVLMLIAGQSTSLSSKEIARELGISFRTVHHHRSHIMKKMGVKSVAELIAISIKARIFI